MFFPKMHLPREIFVLPQEFPSPFGKKELSITGKMFYFSQYFGYCNNDCQKINLKKCGQNIKEYHNTLFKLFSLKKKHVFNRKYVMTNIGIIILYRHYYNT